MARFRAKPIAPRAGRTRPELGSRRGEDAAPPAAWRDGVRAAHRLRQHREPAARAIGARAPERWRSGSRSAPAGRSLIGQLLTESLLLAVLGGSPAWSSHTGRSCSSSRCCRPKCSSTITFSIERRRHPVRHRPDVRHGPAVRALPRAPQHAAGSRLDAQEPGGPAVRREGRRARPGCCSRRRRSRSPCCCSPRRASS